MASAAAILHTPHAPRGDQKAGRHLEAEIWHDAEVAEFFGISIRTLTRRLENPKPGEIDIRMAEPTSFGGRRYWVRAKVLALVGLK